MVGHGGSSAGSYLADPTSPIPSHCASIVVSSTVRVNYNITYLLQSPHSGIPHILMYSHTRQEHYMSLRSGTRHRTQLQCKKQSLYLIIIGFNTYTAKPVCWNGWISDSYCSLKPLCSGMGEVVPARTSPTLLPPSPRTVLSLPCFKVSQCINCHDWHCKS